MPFDGSLAIWCVVKSYKRIKISIYKTKQHAKPVPTLERSASDLDNERIAMHTIQAMGQSANSETSQKLLSIASDESVAADVRLTALETLTANADAMPNSAKTALNNQMAELRQRVTESKQLDETNKERMFGRIGRLQKMTAPQ